MPSIAEIKANSIYYLVRTAGERYMAHKTLSLSLNLEPPDPINDADIFHTEAKKAFNAYGRAKSPLEQAAAARDFAQQQINLGDFPGVRKTVRIILHSSRHLPPKDEDYFEAVAEEKLGWVADYETGYQDALQRFTRVQRILQRRRAVWTDDEAGLNSTATHFLGRARLGLACQGINVQTNITAARGLFITDLSRFEEMRKAGNSQPANEGFQHAWLTMCAITAGNLGAAEKSAAKTKTLFEESLTAKASGIMGHYYLLQGALDLRSNNPQAARAEFLEAARIRTEVEYYPMGLAFAYLGVSGTFLHEGKFTQAVDYFKKAVNTQPPILLYAINGRFGG